MKKAQDIKLTEKNLDISIVGLNTEFYRLSEDEIKKYVLNIDNLENKFSDIEKFIHKYCFHKISEFHDTFC